MTWRAFKITHFVTQLGSEIAPREIYTTPTGQLIVPLVATVYCCGENNEGLEILFLASGATPVENRAGIGPPAWGFICAPWDTYLWYLNLLRSGSVVGIVDADNPKHNRLTAEAYTGLSQIELLRLEMEICNQEVKREKKILDGLKQELDYAEWCFNQTHLDKFSFECRVVQIRIEAQELAILIAEMKKQAVERRVEFLGCQ